MTKELTLAEELLRIRNKAIAEGMKLLSIEEIDALLDRRAQDQAEAELHNKIRDVLDEWAATRPASPRATAEAGRTLPPLASRVEPIDMLAELKKRIHAALEAQQKEGAARGEDK